MKNGLLRHVTLIVSLALLAPAPASYAGTNDFGLLGRAKADSQLASYDFDYYGGFEETKDKDKESAPGRELQEPSACQCGVPQCAGCCRRRVWIAGAEATFLAPQLDGAPLEFAVDDLVAGTTNVYSTTAADLENLYIAPRVWLGVQGERWGLVGRYWRLSDSEDAFDPFLPGDVSGALAMARIDAYTVDLEAVRRGCCRNWDTQLAFGVRHASLENDLSLAVNEVVGADLLSGSVFSTRQFNGVGLTLGLAGRRPLCAKHPNLLLFWNMRGSVLWGDVQSGVETSAALTNAGGSAVAINGAIAEDSDDLFIGEAQLGLQCEYPLACLPASAFLRAAVEYQYWDATGGTAAAFSQVGALPLVVATSVADAGGLRADLIGFTLGAGLTW